MQTAQGKIAQIDEQTDKLLMVQKELREKIEDTNNSLKSVYSIIMQREEERIRLGKEKKSAEAITKAEEATKEKEKIMRREWTQPKIEEKTFIKDLPEQKKNKLVERIEKTADKEEGERKKFLQSIEQWAQDDKDNKKP